MENNTTNNDTPMTGSYTDDDIAKQLKRKQYKPGWYAAVCISDDAIENKSGSLALQQQYRPLSDPNDVTSQGMVTIRHLATLPIRNPKNPDMEVPQTAGLLEKQLRAFGGTAYEGIVAPPKKINGKWTVNGEAIEKNEYETHAMRSAKSVMDKAVELHANPGSLKGNVAFIQVVRNGDYTNIKAFAEELPPGAELVPEEEWFS